MSGAHMDDTFFMREAIKLAQKAFEEDEVPVGAVVVYKNQIIGRGHNQTEHLQDPTAHAEIIAITAAANALGSWRLEDVTVYTTIEPCIMCAGALVLARVKKIVFGARDEKFGGCGSIFDIVNEKKLNHQIDIEEGLLKEQAVGLMKEFFQKKREKTAAQDAAVEGQSED
ncbi:MAG: tRNA adenosine(34) deaminase TadA [candidate division WOR-3 bacterium]|nr:MAG: tRNA adenosine(34) deaminase TadA [candidate division WOR-3 bacterium]